jgi:hypothetical protein
MSLSTPELRVEGAHARVRPSRQVGVRTEASGDRSAAASVWDRPGLWAIPLYLVLQAVQLGVLRRAAPHFFWLDDAQIQFTPMTWWLGRHFDGTPPLLDPDQGMADNLTADMQYGVLDVVRWPFLLFAGQQDSLAGIATAHAWISVFTLGCASLAVLLNHRVRPTLAVAGALGVATSGFMMWWASGWSPQMWSMATLVWLWAALSSHRWYGAVGVGLASAAVVCSGNPWIIPLVPVLVAAYGYERWRELGRGLLRSRQTGATVLALMAGVALSVPTLVNTLDIAQWMHRPAPEYVVASAGGALNLFDLFVGGTTQLNDRNVPMLSTLLFALPLLTLVDWRRAVRSPGVLTAGALWVTAAALTQLPTHLAALRYPFRVMVVVEVALGLLAVLAFASAPLVTRRRLLVAGGLVLLQAAIGLSRSPVLWRWHALSTVLVVLAVLAVLVLVGRLPVVRGVATRWVRPVAAATVVALAASPLLVQVAMMSTVQERYEHLVSGPDDRVDVFRSMTNGYDVGATVPQFRANAYATDTSLTVYPFGVFGDGNDRGWRHGVLGGNANLPADLRVGYGSLAVWHEGVRQVLEADYQNGLAYDQPGLMVVPEGSDVPWVDLLAGNRVLLGLDPHVPGAVSEYFEQHWTLVSSHDGWKEYQRAVPLPGRISQVSGVTVADAAPNDGVAHLGEPLERYTVSTGDSGGRLVFRTPYWNGFRATLDGRPVEVSAFEGSVLQVEVPAGVSSGRLEVFFEPIGARLLPVGVGAGAVLLLSAAAVSVLARRGPRETSRT